MSNQKAQEEYLRETKRLMRSKLEEHGVTVTDSTPFRAYVGGIDQAVANATPPPVVPEEGVEELRAKIRAIVSPQSSDTLELTAEDFADVGVVRRYALYQHANLVSVEIPEGITSIDPSAFFGCTKLETVRLPQKVRLQSGCFGNCTALKRVYLPKITHTSEAPHLINNNVFPDAATSPDLIFMIHRGTSLDVYKILMPDSWGTIIEGRYQIIDEVTDL